MTASAVHSSALRGVSTELGATTAIVGQSAAGRVRWLDAGDRQLSVVELTTAVEDNPIYQTYRALRALGVQVVHAEVARTNNRIVQKLHLLGSDGSSLDAYRLLDVMATLSGLAMDLSTPHTAPELSGAA